MEEKRKPLPIQRKNIFGRKWYSKDCNAADYIECSFDDIWSAVIGLWLAIVVIMTVTFHYFSKDIKKS